MKRRLMLLVAVTTLLVLVAFLVPLAMLVRTSAAEQATNAALREAESLAPLVGTVNRNTLEITAQQLAHDDASDFPLTVYLPDGTVLGAAAPVTPAVRLARSGRSLTAAADGGRQVLVAVQGGPGGTVVIRAFVSTGQLWAGVWQTWLILGLLGLALLALSLLVAHRMARAIIAPIDRLVRTAHRLADGDLDARVSPAGPPEVRDVAGGLNLLADRIGQLLAAEREDVADLSHQLRTPLTALRLSVEAISAEEEQTRLSESLGALEGAVDRVIREARRPVREGVGTGCDAAAITTERVAFWSALAEDENRPVASTLPDEPAPVRSSAEDLVTALDALLGNVFAHTPEGTAFSVDLEPQAQGAVALTVSDEGPGPPHGSALSARGAGDEGSTGLGLDIARRTAEASGGSLRTDRSPRGGLRVTVTLGPPPGLSGNEHSGQTEDQDRAAPADG
jgi:signal transduction histidine kinase